MTPLFWLHLPQNVGAIWRMKVVTSFVFEFFVFLVYCHTYLTFFIDIPLVGCIFWIFLKF
jgi:hypothetical protein